jgi:hypothetical protein
MLGGIGFLSGGSRVIVPNIVGLSTSAASTALSNVGLVLGSSTGSTSTGATSGNNGYVASQSISTDADRGDTITYTTYSYSPPDLPLSWADQTISTSFTAGTPYSDGVSANNAVSYSIGQPDGNVYPYWVQGVEMNGGTGQFSGTPSTAGQVFKFFVRAFNAAGSYIDTATFSGTVASAAPPPNISLAVSFASPSSSSSLSGTINAQNNMTGASYSVSVTTTAGTVSPSSFVLNGYESKNVSFTVSGLSGGQTATVTASSNGVSGSNSETTLSAYTYRFASAGGGYPSALDGETVSAQGIIEATGPQIGTTVYVNAGTGCGSSGIFINAPQFYYWRCFRKSN